MQKNVESVSYEVYVNILHFLHKQYLKDIGKR